MKKVSKIIFLFFLIITTPAFSQDCNCYDNEVIMIADANILYDGDGNVFLSGKCLEVRRIYFLRDGLEVEENQVACKSSNRKLFRIHKKFELVGSDEKDFRKKINDLSNHLTEYVLNITVKKENIIEQISPILTYESFNVKYDNNEKAQWVPTKIDPMPALKIDNNDKAKGKKQKLTSEQLYEKAWEEYQQENYNKALQSVNELIDNYNEHAAAYYELKAYILINLKRNKEIIETCNKALKLYPNNPVFYDIRGNTYYFEFMPDSALADYRRLLELEKGNARYYNNYLKLLNELRKDNEMQKVFAVFENEKEAGTSFESEKFLGDVYFYAALPYGRKENYEKAIELLTHAIKEKPTASMYYNNRAMYYIEIEENDKAMRDFDKAISLDPEVPSYYVNRTRSHFKNNDHVSGRKDLLKALSMGDSDNGIYADLAITYLIDKDYEKAAHYYAIYNEKVTNNIVTLGNYAYVLLELNDVPKAKMNFEKAYAIDPKEIDIVIGLMAIAHLEKQNNSLARLKNDFVKKFPERKLSKSLLDELENEGYSYSDNFKKLWQQLF